MTEEAPESIACKERPTYGGGEGGAAKGGDGDVCCVEGTGTGATLGFGSSKYIKTFSKPALK